MTFTKNYNVSNNQGNHNSPKMIHHSFAPADLNKRPPLFIGSRSIQDMPVPTSNTTEARRLEDDFPFVLALPDAVGLPPRRYPLDALDLNRCATATTNLRLDTSSSPVCVDLASMWDPSSFRTPTKKRRRTKSKFFLPKRRCVADFDACKSRSPSQPPPPFPSF